MYDNQLAVLILITLLVYCAPAIVAGFVIWRGFRREEVRLAPVVRPIELQNRDASKSGLPGRRAA